MSVETATRYNPREVIHFAKSMRGVLSHAKGGPAKLGVTVGESQSEPGVMECKVVITGSEAGQEYELAKDYEDKGWTCQSSGEKEVTCTSPD